MQSHRNDSWCQWHKERMATPCDQLITWAMEHDRNLQETWPKPKRSEQKSALSTGQKLDTSVRGANGSEAGEPAHQKEARSVNTASIFNPR